MLTSAPGPQEQTEDLASIEEAVEATVESTQNDLDLAASLVSSWEAQPAEHSGKGAVDGQAASLGLSGAEVAAYISRAFRVPLADAQQLTVWALEIGAGFNVDPLLILAVAGTESSFNPKAKSAVGAEGLMQVMTRVHKEKFEAFGGRKAAFEPYANMVVGTTILKSLVKRTGSVSKALKWYCGAANHKTDRGYSAKVLRERSRLEVAASGDSDAAVALSRKSASGPGYKKAASAKHLDYSQWTKVVEVALDKRDGADAKTAAAAASRGVKPLRDVQMAEDAKASPRSGVHPASLSAQN